MQEGDELVRTAQEHFDNNLTMRFDPKARQAVHEFVGQRRRFAISVGGEVEPAPTDLALAQDNVRRLLRRAEQEAQARQLKEVDVESVQAAIRGLCPGLYPIC